MRRSSAVVPHVTAIEPPASGGMPVATRSWSRATGPGSGPLAVESNGPVAATLPRLLAHRLEEPFQRGFESIGRLEMRRMPGRERLQTGVGKAGEGGAAAAQLDELVARSPGHQHRASDR